MLDLHDLGIAFRRVVASGYRLYPDIHDLQAHVSSVLAPHEMTLAGDGEQTEASLARLTVGDVSLVLLRYGAEVIVRPMPTVDYVMLQFIISGSIEVEYGGVCTVGLAGSGLIIESLFERSLKLSYDCEQIIIPVPRGVIARAAERITGKPSPANYDFDRTFALDDQPGQSLLAFMRYLLAVPPSMAESSNPTGRLMSELIAHHLIQNHRNSVPNTPQSNIAPYYVLRAERFMRGKVDQSLELTDIAHQAGVSPRTLSAAFRRFRNASPMEWLRDHRLDLVRTWLQSEDVTTIAHTAARAGFTHPGRFSQVYRDRFGESPSETIAISRAKSTPA